MNDTIPESRSSISADVASPVNTGADIQAPVRTRAENEELNHTAWQEAWQKLIDHKLIEWGRNLDQFADEGIEPPTGEIVQRAITLAGTWRNQNFPPPHTVVPDPNGGIVFKRRAHDVVELFHIWEDGTLEYQRFCGTKLLERDEIEI